MSLNSMDSDLPYINIALRFIYYFPVFYMERRFRISPSLLPVPRLVDSIYIGMYVGTLHSLLSSSLGEMWNGKGESGKHTYPFNILEVIRGTDWENSIDWRRKWKEEWVSEKA